MFGVFNKLKYKDENVKKKFIVIGRLFTKQNWRTL